MPEREISEFGRGRHAVPISPSYIRWERGRISQVGLMTSRYLLYSFHENPGLARFLGPAPVCCLALVEGDAGARLIYFSAVRRLRAGTPDGCGCSQLNELPRACSSR